jgi:hypothetical protein
VWPDGNSARRQHDGASMEYLRHGHVLLQKALVKIVDFA